jgi:acyl-homoserine lactone acylase PvdQ
VSDIRSWIDARQPPAPMDLRPWLHTDLESGSMTERIARLARTALDEARANPGRVRESAFHLLAADALVTYACEAALDEADPSAALRTILLETAGSR